jgi:APA family basic amino acid/polyamine antiporter
MLAGSGIVVVLYLLLNVAILGNLPSNEIAGVEAVVARLVEQLFGSGASRVFALLIAIVLLSSIGVSSFAGPRVLHRILLSREEKMMPIAPPVPARLLWIQAGVSIVLVLTGSFEQVMSLMGVFLGIAPVLTVLGIYRRKWNGPEYHPFIRYVAAPLFIGFSSVIILISLMGNRDAITFVFGLFAISLSLMVLEAKGLVRVR